jgi:hypothetical protein
MHIDVTMNILIYVCTYIYSFNKINIFECTCF